MNKSLLGILYVCLRYLFLLQFGDWSSLDENHWLGDGTIDLLQKLWLPIVFIIFIIFIHLRRYFVLKYFLISDNFFYNCLVHPLP